jgi:diaminopimelate epimerase
MRVHERGVGETRSCGTGICAVVTVAALAAGDTGSGDRPSWQVEVAGGVCEVSWTDAGEVVLTGPAVLVGSILISDDWLAEHR